MTSKLGRENDVVGVFVGDSCIKDGPIQTPASKILHRASAQQSRFRVRAGRGSLFHQQCRLAPMRKINTEREADRPTADDEDRDFDHEFV